MIALPDRSKLAPDLRLLPQCGRMQTTRRSGGTLRRAGSTMKANLLRHLGLNCCDDQSIESYTVDCCLVSLH